MMWQRFKVLAIVHLETVEALPPTESCRFQAVAFGFFLLARTKTFSSRIFKIFGRPVFRQELLHT